MQAVAPVITIRPDSGAAPSPANTWKVDFARSVGMIISVEAGFTGTAQVSTCSVTLVDADKVITAGHCHTPAEALSSSVTFDYQTDCAGNRPAGYAAQRVRIIGPGAQAGADTRHSELRPARPGLPGRPARASSPARA